MMVTIYSTPDYNGLLGQQLEVNNCDFQSFALSVCEVVYDEQSKSEHLIDLFTQEGGIN